MAQRPTYARPTAPVAIRITAEARRLYEWLALSTGAPTLGAYLRHVLEQHLVDVGFKLEVGVTAALPLPPPTPEAVAEWQAQEPAHEQEPARTAS